MPGISRFRTWAGKKRFFEWGLRKPIEGQRISLLLTGRAVSNANPRFSTGGALLVKVNGII